MLSSGVPTLELVAWALALGFGAAVGWSLGTWTVKLLARGAWRMVHGWLE